MMRAALLTGIRRIETRVIEAPALARDTDVLIRVASVGVCGSDVHYYNEGKIGDQVVAFPFAIGHEMAGVVERVGSRVTRVRRSDRVIVDPAIHCGECSQCAAGRFHTCKRLRFLGCPGQIEGCLSELVVMPEKCVYRIPDSMSTDLGVLCEPLAIGLHAVGLAGLSRDASIGILGLGPIGLSVLAASSLAQSRRVYGSDILDYRCDAGLRLGASWAGNPGSIDVASEIRKMEPDGLDAVFECSGTQEALDLSLGLLAPGGRLMIVGIPDAEKWSFDAHGARRLEISIRNVRRQNCRTEDAIELASKRGSGLARLVTHHFPLEDAAKAFELVSDYADNVIKAIIRVAT